MDQDRKTDTPSHLHPSKARHQARFMPGHIEGQDLKPSLKSHLEGTDLMPSPKLSGRG